MCLEIYRRVKSQWSIILCFMSTLALWNPTYTSHKTVSAVIDHLGLNLTCTAQITPKWGLSGTVGPAYINTHSWLCAGSGVEERNVKHLLDQPQCDPSTGQYRSAKSDSEKDISLTLTPLSLGQAVWKKPVSHDCCYKIRLSILQQVGFFKLVLISYHFKI